MIEKIKAALLAKTDIQMEQIDVHECRVMGRVDTYRITLPQGVTYNKAIVHKEVGGACILPIDKDGNAYMETQYRAPIKETILEVPAGRKEKDEGFETCAIRELKEETGCTSKNFIRQYEYFTQAEFSDERIASFLAREVENTDNQELDRDENVNIIKVPISVVKELIKTNVITDEKTIIAVGLGCFFDLKKEDEKVDEEEIIRVKKKIEEDNISLQEEEIDVAYTYPCEFGFVQDHIIKTSTFVNSRRECMYMRRGDITIPISKNNRIGIKIKYMPAVEQNCIEFPEKKEIIYFYGEQEFKYIGEIATSVGYTNDKQDVYVTFGVEENDRFIWVEKEEVKEIIKEELISDGKVLAAILKLLFSLSEL